MKIGDLVTIKVDTGSTLFDNPVELLGIVLEERVGWYQGDQYCYGYCNGPLVLVNGKPVRFSETNCKFEVIK